MWGTLYCIVVYGCLRILGLIVPGICIYHRLAPLSTIREPFWLESDYGRGGSGLRNVGLGAKAVSDKNSGGSWATRFEGSSNRHLIVYLVMYFALYDI